MQIDSHAAVSAPQAANLPATARYSRSPPRPPLSLAALLLLWNLSVTMPMEQLLDSPTLLADTAERQVPQPARLPPLQDNGWRPAP